MFMIKGDNCEHYFEKNSNLNFSYVIENIFLIKSMDGELDENK